MSRQPVCGLNNCPESLGHDPDVDCCYNATVGDEDFCTTDNPCGSNEGDCDSDNECQTKLICDTANSCPASLGFALDVNCFFQGCKYHKKLSHNFNFNSDSSNSLSSKIYSFISTIKEYIHLF